MVLIISISVEPLKKLRTATVTVNVLVMRQDFENGHKFFLEEQVTFVEGKKVDQVDIKVLTIHMRSNGKEYKRTVEAIAFEQSHMKEKTVQKICNKGMWFTNWGIVTFRIYYQILNFYFIC